MGAGRPRLLSLLLGAHPPSPAGPALSRGEAEELGLRLTSSSSPARQPRGLVRSAVTSQPFAPEDKCGWFKGQESVGRERGQHPWPCPGVPVPFPEQEGVSAPALPLSSTTLTLWGSGWEQDVAQTHATSCSCSQLVLCIPAWPDPDLL